jgi:hypothetical protein
MSGHQQIALDGADLYELYDHTLFRRDNSLVERSRVVIENAMDFTVLPDHSVIVLASTKGYVVHHVVAGRVVATVPSPASRILATKTPSAYLSIDSWISRVDLATGVSGPWIVLPDSLGTHLWSAEALPDGSVVMGSNAGILRIDQQVETYEFGSVQNLAPGPTPDSVWANADNKVVLLQLANGRATPIATHVVPTGDTLVHLSSNGPLAAACIAHPLSATRATSTLVVYDAKGERWRTAVGEYETCVTVMSATRVVVQAAAQTELLRSYDVATGKPIATATTTPGTPPTP